MNRLNRPKPKGIKVKRNERFCLLRFCEEKGGGVIADRKEEGNYLVPPKTKLANRGGVFDSGVSILPACPCRKEGKKEKRAGGKQYLEEGPRQVRCILYSIWASSSVGLLDQNLGRDVRAGN